MGSPKSWLYSVTFANTAAMHTLPNIRPALRTTGVLLMVVLLTLLTTLNFFLYSGMGDTPSLLGEKVQGAEGRFASGNFPNAADFPEEKAPDDSGGVSEDYLHDASFQAQPEHVSAVLYPTQAHAKLPESFGGQLTPPPEC